MIVNMILLGVAVAVAMRLVTALFYTSLPYAARRPANRHRGSPAL